MSTTEIKGVQQEICSQFELLKKGLDEKIEAEVKGRADVLLKEEIERINNAITKNEDKVEKIEKAQAMNNAIRVVGDAVEQVEDPVVRKAYDQWLRKNADQLEPEYKNIVESGMAYKAKGLNSLSDSAGGYLVRPFMDTEFTRALYEMSPIRQIANIIQISTDQYQKPQQVDAPGAYWQDRDHEYDDTDAVTFGQLIIRVHDLVARPLISQKLLDDAFVDVEAMLSSLLADVFARMEGAAFVLGTGAGEPRGFLNYPKSTTQTWGSLQYFPSGSASAITSDSLLDMQFGLTAGYGTGTFVMHKLTIAALRKLKTTTGEYIWSPGFGSTPSTIFESPVVRAADMPTVAAGAYPVAYGNFTRGYIIVDRFGLRVLRDPFTRQPHIQFTTTKRVGGAVDDFSAIKLLKIATS